MFVVLVTSNNCTQSGNAQCEHLCLQTSTGYSCACPMRMLLKNRTHCEPDPDYTLPDCYADPSKFRCLDSGLCIRLDWTCDGDLDCGANDNSDENIDTCRECDHDEIT